jgi:cell cycle sensor histidine kinase DivJ
MGSLFSFRVSKEMSLALAGSGHRPEMLRRNTLANNARFTILASALCMPICLFWLGGGEVLPFVVAMLGLLSGTGALALYHRGEMDNAVMVQVYALTSMGVLLSLASSKLGDFGMGIILMGAVLAALLARGHQRRQSWSAIFAVILLVGLAHLTFPPLPVAPAVLLQASTATFFFCMVVVIHTANRINVAYEVYDKSQVTAYRHLVEHVQDGVLRFAGNGEVLLASQSSEKLFGCQRYELTAQSIGDRLHVLDRPVFLTAFADASQRGTSRVIEVRMRKDDPHTSGAPQFNWVEVSLSPVMENVEGGMRHEVIALLRDISARKTNEAAMAEARRQAEEASEAKTRFLATIGHELRTPLNAVVGFSEMMSSGIGGELAPTHKEYAGLIHQSGRHLLDVVGMLLDMSKLEAGKFELQTEPFQMQSIIEPSFKMIEATAAQRGIRLRTEIAPKLPMLIGDERACRQILLNLLSNAIKFSHDSGTVTVSLKRQGQCLNLTVADEGIGMAPESLSRVGEPFFQAQDGLARRYEGTGLGLSIVKGLVDLHGGTLRAMSEIGSGTSVTVLLPINGPAIKTEETGNVTPIRKEPSTDLDSQWQDEKRKAQ